MLLYHFHLGVADVRADEALWGSMAVPFRVVARYGHIGEERVDPGPEVTWEALRDRGFRLQLVELERGAVNVSLMPRDFPERRLGHFGVAVSEEEQADVLARATRLRLAVRGNEVRSFLSTGQGFEIELSSADRYRYDREALDELRLTGLTIACRAPREAVRLTRELFGHEIGQQVSFVEGPRGWAELRRWSFTNMGASWAPGRAEVIVLRSRSDA